VANRSIEWLSGVDGGGPIAKGGKSLMSAISEIEGARVGVDGYTSVGSGASRSEG